MAASVNIESLSVRFSDTVLAVSEFSATIPERQFVSIVGPSGCGKTTVLNVLAGLIGSYQGGVSINGRPPAAGSPQIAYMLARDCLLPWRSALDNAAYGLEIRGEPLASRHERAAALLARVGLAGFEQAWPRQLSHGMRQRVALARTFCLPSGILLMDEPFGALDAQTKIQLEDVLLDLWSTEARLVVFVTHDLAEAVALSDRVIVMSARPGRIVADIPIDIPRPRSVRELQGDPEFHRIYGEIWKIFESGLQAPAASTT